MSKTDPEASKKARNKTIRWVVTIFFVTIVISGTISFISDEVMSGSGIFTCFLILLAIILVLVTVKHRANIGRILNGTEPKAFARKN